MAPSRQIRPGLALVAALTCGPAAGLFAQQPVNIYTTPDDIETGQVLFSRHCALCHGFDGTGGENGTDLTTGEFKHSSTDTGLFNTVSNGVPNTLMIGIYRTRTDQSVWQVVAFLRSLSRGARVEVPGDAMAGGQLYRGKGDCSSCHTIDGEGSRIGPDLSRIGDLRRPAQLMSDLVEPDERVQPRWWTMRVTHRDGTRIEGRRMNEGTYSVRILDAENEMWSFLKRDLRESERIETSSMPSYRETFTDEELEDLVAYLYGLTRDN